MSFRAWATVAHEAGTFVLATSPNQPNQLMSASCSLSLAVIEGHMPDKTITTKLSGKVVIQNIPKLFAVMRERVVLSKLKNADPKIVYSVLVFRDSHRDWIWNTNSDCSGRKKEHCHVSDDLHCLAVILQRVAISLIDCVERLPAFSIATRCLRKLSGSTQGLSGSALSSPFPRPSAPILQSTSICARATRAQSA